MGSRGTQAQSPAGLAGAHQAELLPASMAPGRHQQLGGLLGRGCGRLTPWPCGCSVHTVQEVLATAEELRRAIPLVRRYLPFLGGQRNTNLPKTNRNFSSVDHLAFTCVFSAFHLKVFSFSREIINDENLVYFRTV